MVVFSHNLAVGPYRFDGCFPSPAASLARSAAKASTKARKVSREFTLSAKGELLYRRHLGTATTATGVTVSFRSNAERSAEHRERSVACAALVRCISLFASS